jgi:hypothetical protein
MAITVDVSKTILGIDALTVRMDLATEDIVADALRLFQLAGKAEAPVGTPGNTTNPPGDLARSISVSGPIGGDGVYSGKVGPTTIYGRQRELGGAIRPVYASFLHFFRWGKEEFRFRVFQEGDHYMRRAYKETLPNVEIMAQERVARVIVEIP